MSRSRIMAAVAVAIVALGAATAQATTQTAFTSIDVDFPNLPIGVKPTWTWPADGNNASLKLSELFASTFGGPNGEVLVTISGVTDMDPVLSISKDVMNDTGTTWIGYDITLDTTGSNTFVLGTATSDRLILSSESTSALSFGLPSPVADGEMANFSFDVLIPTMGPFVFTLTQTPVPIPEPGTISLMALVGLAFVRRRRR